MLPTYTNLVSTTTALRQAIVALSNNPSTNAFKNAANLWIEAREPWETSEAFLFGPVADLGLDPNMDSWPLDVDAIKIVSDGVDALRSPQSGFIVITHYPSLLESMKPDAVHVLKNGRIACTGGMEVAQKVQTDGFESF